MSPQNSLGRDSQVPGSNSPHVKEFHWNVTDAVALSNPTRVSFCDFDSINLTFHSHFLAHLDFCWSNRNNIVTAACWRWTSYLLTLLPNDTQGEREKRESFQFHETFHVGLEMGLIAKDDNNTRSTSGNTGAPILLRKTLQVGLFSWTELVSLRPLIMHRQQECCCEDEIRQKGRTPQDKFPCLCCFWTHQHLIWSKKRAPTFQSKGSYNWRN